MKPSSDIEMPSVSPAIAPPPLPVGFPEKTVLRLKTHRRSAKAPADGSAKIAAGECRSAEGRDVYVSFTRVSTSDQPIENATIVAEEMLKWLRDIEGFEGLLTISRAGTTLGLTFWESSEAAQRHRVVRMQFLDRMTSIADVQIEEILDFQVTFAHLGARLTGDRPGS